MSGILLVTSKIQESPPGGRELLSKLNRDVLKDLYGDNLVVVEVQRKSLRGIVATANAFKGYIDGLDAEACAMVCSFIHSRKIEKVILDGSGYGQLAKKLVNLFPRVNVIVFFHNVEARFFWGAFKQLKTFHSLGVLAVNYLAERKSVKFAHKIICLSSRDSRMLLALYGREASYVSAMALQDSLQPQTGLSPELPVQNYLLFVGGSFYANRHGIAWFVHNVVPSISITTVVIGTGLEDMKQSLENYGDVMVVGGVDNLAAWYRNALAVVAPIFDGSGMKTKVAEALMHGKKVIGTPEAFSGYENVVSKAGWVCTSQQDFVEAIAAAQETTPVFLSELRSLYDQFYSFNAARLRLSKILEAVSE